MFRIVLGVIGIVLGLVIMGAQATGNFGHQGENGYILGAIFIFFGILRIARGINRG